MGKVGDGDLLINGVVIKPEGEPVKINRIGENHLDNISALRISDNECSSQWEFMQQYHPKKSIKMAWIPHTMGDQVWVLYKFENKQDRRDWETSLPNKVFVWLDKKLIPEALEFGWHIRDSQWDYDKSSSELVVEMLLDIKDGLSKLKIKIEEDGYIFVQKDTIETMGDAIDSLKGLSHALKVAEEINHNG